MNGEPPCWTSCSDGTEGKLGDTAWEQPALFALECALTALWSSVGIRPGVVMGHSVGELAAAHTAGVFSLEDGMRFACARGALLSTTEPGAMAAVFAPAPQVAAEVQAANTLSAGIGVNISADNGTHQVISGPVDEVETIMKRLESEGIRARRLNTAKAFHSALVEPALDALETSLDGVKTEPPSLAVVSNLTGRVVKSGQALDGTYWRRHAREPVAFARGVGTLAELGVDLVLEIGPHAVLAPMALSAWPESAQTPAPMVLSSLQRPSGNGAAPAGGSFTEAAAAAYEAGLPVRFAGLFAGESRRRISIPGYPFQRRRHWVETAKQRRGSADHPLLGERHESARGEITFETELFRSDPEWLNDHRVFNRVVAPGALYGAMAASAMLCEGDWPVVVEDMQLHNPLVFPEESAQEDEAGKDEDKDSRKLQVVLDASEQAPSRPVQIFSKGNEEGWTVHVEGRVSADAPVPEAAGRIDAESLKSVLSPVDVAGYYRARAGTGVDLGPSFRTLGKAWSRQGEALGEVSFPAALGSSGTDIHPLLLDGCFQVVGIARGLTGTQSTTTYLPFGWERLWLTQKLPEQALCHVRMNQVFHERGWEQEEDTGEPPEVLSGELRIYDANGVLIGGINGYTVKRATRAALLSAVEGVKDLLYEIVWRERALPPGMKAADFFPGPATIAAEAQLFTDYLTEAGVPPESRDALLQDLERWSRRRALATLEELGWQRVAGETVDPEALRQQLNVIEEHRRLFRRMFEMLARSGVVAETDAGFTVLLGPEDPLP
ncbi:MAG: polyketide synthase dehydratase domain-containing protein, partial [Gammaproteobacteria bacterium]|nr:polyketide synthase dehydratase domain-containing protein [Gammaproteobacteria bacterium]